VSQRDELAPGGPRRRGVWPGWYLVILALVLVFLGWIPALILVLAVLCIGFIMTQQKREERRSTNSRRD
jgi:hypothetical protein